MYHIHNEGNKGELIFYNEDNYALFKSKMRKYIVPYCDLVSYCLLPNSFDLMIHANALTGKEVKIGVVKMSLFSAGIKKLLSSYTQALNKIRINNGSIFRQNTKCQLLDEDLKTSTEFTFHYIHQLPVMTGVVRGMGEWKHSSYNNYFNGTRTGLFDVVRGRKMLDARGISCRAKLKAAMISRNGYLKLFQIRKY